MSDALTELSETADKLFGSLNASRAGLAQSCATVIDAGFPSLLVPELAGGVGGDWSDALAVLRLAGYHALEVPLADMILAQHLAVAVGLRLGSGLAVIAARAEGTLENACFTGRLHGVARGRRASEIVASHHGQLLLLRRIDAESVIESCTPANEERDVLVFSGARAQAATSRMDLFALGAATRTALIAGALDALLGSCVGYANQRVQFGRPLAKLQAVQQNLALLAEEAGAVSCAAHALGLALRFGAADFEIAAAKLRANAAAAAAVPLAHQIHGAIGFTREFGLHRWTGLLLACASEFGAERYWARLLGGSVAQRGHDALWPDLTARSDRNGRQAHASAFVGGNP